MQSPIDLPLCRQKDAERPVIQLSWGTSQKVELFNNDHTVQINVLGKAGKMVVGKNVYTLVQCHWHWGSEHTIGGVQQVMCLHCVHTKDSWPGRYGVLGVFYKVGDKADPFLKKFQFDLPQGSHRRLAGGKTMSAFSGPLNWDLAYKGLNLGEYWTYKGSFTTPPCTEAVDWYPLMGKKTVTSMQLDLMREAMGHAGAGGNYRPPQPLFNRDVQGCVTEDWYPYKATSWALRVGAESSSNACLAGKFQSPVDLPACTGDKIVRRMPISIRWGTQDVQLINNDHTVQLNVINAANPPTMVAGGAIYTLVQCHWHWGSEHTVGGYQYPLAVHCVHAKKNANRFGVLGVFYEVGSSPDAFLAQFEDHLPPSMRRRPHMRRLADGSHVSVSDFRGPLDFDLLHAGIDKTQYWTYPGSLTTPPCSEVVDWYPLMGRQQITKEQFNKFKVAIGWAGEGGNYRPPQPRSGRLIEGCHMDWYPYDTTQWAKGVDSAHDICGTGRMQSPVDLPTCDKAAERPALSVSWGVRRFELLNNGHTVQITVQGGGGKMGLGSKTYTHVQCHWHWGSEHFIGGEQQPLAVHCVHTLDGQPGKYGVLGIFYKVVPKANYFLQQFEDYLPYPPVETADHRRLGAAHAVNISRFSSAVDLDSIHSDLRKTRYWTYDGSFTTPPCTEVVDWYLLMDKASVTKSQLDKMSAAMGWKSANGNFRPPQPLFGRMVQGCTAADWYPYEGANWARAVASPSLICSSGSFQSPIDLPNCEAEDIMPRPAIEIRWGVQKVQLINNDHTVQLNLVSTDVSSRMIAGGAEYALVQCHWHWGSEHTIGGQQMPLAVHCVHKKVGTSRFGVLGIFYEVRVAPDKFMQQFEDKLPASSSRRRFSQGRRLEWESPTPAPVSAAPAVAAVGADARGGDAHGADGGDHAVSVSEFQGPLNFDLMHASLDKTRYWTYPGSLTTPPCSEVVDWYPLMTRAVMSQAQLDKFKAAIGWGSAGGNYRPPQPRKGRLVEGCRLEWYPYDVGVWAQGGEKAHEVCRSGHMQSPVDLPACAKPEDRPMITVAWGNNKVELVNNGHTVQMNVASGHGGKMMVGQSSYTLVQCHWHWGSEHTIAGEQQEMVVHCVHNKDGAAGRYGVLGIFYQVSSKPSPFLSNFEDKLPRPPPKVPTEKLALASAAHADEPYGAAAAEGHHRLLSSATTVSQYSAVLNWDGMHVGLRKTRYWSYDGSFTTPPCTEVVDWFVLMDKAPLTKSQLGKFSEAMGWRSANGNFRPPQPLYGRHVLGCYYKSWYPYDVSSWANGVRDANPLCATGKFQSPVDLPECAAPLTQKPLKTAWGVRKVVLKNNGHAVQLDVVGGAGKMMAPNGDTYTLVQCHMHWGSENTIDGKQMDMEAHCVQTKDHDPGWFGVLGIFYKVDLKAAPNPFLASIEPYLPRPAVASGASGGGGGGGGHRRLGAESISAFQGPVNFDTIYADLKLDNFWSYKGSLTTPPCVEVVDWFVLMGKVAITEGQLSSFQTAIGSWSGSGNFRPPQPLNGRVVVGCTSVASRQRGGPEIRVVDAARPTLAGLLPAALAVLAAAVGAPARCRW